MDDSNEGGKVTGISQIVRLKGFLQKWQRATLGPKNGDYSPLSATGISPAVSRRLMASTIHNDSDEDSNCQSPEPPLDVPKGYLAVYVGPELRRFIIPTSYLSDPKFKVLLEKVEEEFGFNHSGGLTIPCEIETFKFLLQHLEHHHDKDQPEEELDAAEIH